MKILIFGATGMIGQAVLREALLDPRVDAVTVVGRAPTRRQDPKLREIIHADMMDIAPVADDIAGCDACLFCLGISSFHMTEADYARTTHDLTLGVASALAARNPDMTFVYVSATGADSTENGRIMWARVRGRTENDLFRLPFKAVYSVRPALIEPMHGVTSRTRYVDTLYRIIRPFVPLIRLLGPNHVCTSEQMGRMMVGLGKHGGPARVVENRDIAAIVI